MPPDQEWDDATPANKPKLDIADVRPPKFSDEALAEAFAERHEDDLRYVAAWGQWFSWNHTRWELDTTLHAFDHARAICRIASDTADKPNIKTSLASAKTVAATEKLAKVDRRIAADVEQWDVEPDVFNAEVIELI